MNEMDNVTNESIERSLEQSANDWTQFARDIDQMKSDVINLRGGTKTTSKILRKLNDIHKLAMEHASYVRSMRRA